MADFKPLRNIVNITGEDDSGWTPLRNISVGQAPQRNALAAGLSSGTDVLQGLGYSAFGGAADLASQVGIPYAAEARDWANEQARRNAIDASINGRPDLENIEDQTLGSALPYLGYQITKQVPIMAGITAAQFVPGLGQAASATGLTRLGAVLPRAIGGGGLEAGASIAARRAALAQGEALATGTMVGSGLGFGSLYGESVEGGNPNALKALALSPIYGAAEAVLPAVLQGGLRVPTNFAGNRALRMAKAGGIAGAGESLTELGQNELEMSMRSDLTPEQKYSQRLNSAAAGFFVGGTLGTSGGFANRLGAGAEVDLMPNGEQKPAPLQQRINEQLGIGAKRVAGKDYAAQFKAAFNEPSGQYAQDPITGIERELTMGELMQLGTAPLDLTVANPAANAAAATVVNNVAKSRDPQDILLRDTLNVIPNQYSRALLSAMVESGIDPESKIAESAWNFAGQKYMTAARLTKALAILDEAIIEARKGTANVSTTPTIVPTAPAGLGTGGPVVQGGVGTSGPSVIGTFRKSPGPSVPGTPTRQTQPATTTRSQPTSPVTTPSNLQTTRGAPGTTPLVDTSDDALEIARATGNAAEIEAMREDEAGLRADTNALTDDDVNKIVGTRFAKSKNAKRDTEILSAYLTALRTNAGTDKAAIQKAIGDKYGITAVAVRKIGNPSKLVEAGAELGFSAEQVLDLFQVDDNTKAQFTEIGKIESEIKDLRKAYNNATDADKRKEIADRMAALSERITKINERAADEKATAFSAGLEAAGISGAEGESAGFGFDTEREWARVEGESKVASLVLELSNQIESLRETAAELDAQGQSEAADVARSAIAERQAKIDAAFATATGETKPAAKPTKAKAKTEAAQKAAEEKDAAEEEKAAKLRSERAAKLASERKGLAVGDTVVNPKLGTGTVLGFSGNGAETIVKVKFLNGQTKDLSVQAAKLEKTNAVQVQSPTGVPVQPKTQTSQGVGTEVRGAEKPAGEGETKILTPQEQYEKVTAGFPAPAWTDLTDAQRSSLTDLARRDQLNLAAVNRFVTAEEKPDVQVVAAQVKKLTDGQTTRLEKHYGVGRDTAEFLAKVKEDIVLYVNKGASAVAGAIRDIIKVTAEGVLAVALVFNPNANANLNRFKVNVPQVIEKTAEVRAEVPAKAAAKMSRLAKDVYSRVAPAAMESGKGFIVADKPNGMIHVFTSKGEVIVQDTALFGMDAGDVMTGQKITPAGKFTMKSQKWEDYAGGYTLDVWTSNGEFEGVAIHAAYLGIPSQNRLSRLATPTAADNKISGGCINTSHDTFIEKIIPNLDVLDGGMLFVLPDAQETTASLFPAQTKTTKTPVQDTKTTGVDRMQVGKEEDGTVRFSKMSTAEAENPRAPKARRSGEIVLAIDDFLGTNLRANPQWAKFVRVHDNAEAAFRATGKKIPMAQLANTQGFVDPRDPRVVHLIASNIAKGNELSVLIHELGVHVGLTGQLGSNFKLLEAQVRSWKNAPKTSIEYQVWEAANARTAAAALEGAVTEKISGEELVAYAAEEAVLMGVKPSKNAQDKLSRFLQSIKEMVERAFQKFFNLEMAPSVSAQDLVDFAFAAAQSHAGKIRTEIGTDKSASDNQIMRFYAGTDNGGTLATSAKIANQNGVASGQEEFHWGTDSKYGSFTGITTDGFRYRTPDRQDVFQMVITSSESRKIAEQNPAPAGANDIYDDVLNTVMLVRSPGDSHWDLFVQGPDPSTPLYNELYVEGKATTVKDNDGNYGWTRIENIPMRDTRRMLVEARRRLTRSLGGVIPEIRFVRVTGSGTALSEGRPGRYTADQISIRYSKKPTESMIAKNIAKLPKAAQQPVRNMIGEIKDLTGKRLDYAVFTSDLVSRATAAGITSAKKFVDLIGKSKTESRANEIAVEKISDMYALVPEKDRGTGDASVNRFLFDSTREGKWGYGQYRDDEMGNRFDALSKEAQDFVKAVFTHGSTVLAQKKKIVLDSANSEYDAMIAAAQADIAQAVTADEKVKAQGTLASLKAEKAATLKRFQTLFKIRDGMPYAPIKRNGNYAVIAKSQAYLDAEAAKDAKKITELESNGDHYHVSFTEGKWEGRTLQQQLIDQGAFADVQLAERDSVVDEMFSGHSALRELTAMRSRVDAKVKDDDKSASKMLHLISQMYLEALAEGSARKSEMRRRGVEGEVDMIRSFAQQGRADANFMASVKYNSQVQEALQEMRKQAKQGDRTRKSEIFNELAKRYMQSMDYNPRPWLNKLTRMSSIYYLATSPAYYLQNLTQPWMMSVPAMAGHHDYTAASGALFKAYTELGGVMKSAKLLKQQFDFAKVPADVRDAIQELVNRGKIDIGLDTEIGEFKVEGEGYFAGKISAADKALRLAVQKVESINRLSTAMAAYRLELEAAKANPKIKDPKAAAIDYADRILTETHGDYTSFNAPRIFNTGFGKVALQFRKFQLIQLAFYAKLIKESLHGADRKAALKTLAFSLAHTGTLAGLMGMPGYAAISWAIGALLGDDDEPYDLTAAIRKAIGDEDVANLILKGTPTLAGMDISGKVGAGNMLSLMPFSQADLSTTAGRAEAFGTLVGSATLGMTSRMLDGLGLMLSGDWYRGIEQTMPKGVSDAMKAWRIANEGMTRRNGDVIVPASEISGLEAIMQGFGITPVKLSTTYERQNVVKELVSNFQERTTEIKNQYTRADRKGDTEAKAEAREAWKNLQDARVRNGLARKPLSDLLKAPAEQRKREKETMSGVQYTKATKKLVKQYAEE